MVNKNKIPCKDCICFAICKAQVTKYINDTFEDRKAVYLITPNLMAYYIFIDVLNVKCSIFTDWINENLKWVNRSKCFNKTYHTFVHKNGGLQIKCIKTI